jgi:ABC-type lipoprotein release transport system permease subunit
MERAMPRGAFLGKFEQIILLAVVRLKDAAYGITIRDEIEACTGRDVSIGGAVGLVGAFLLTRLLTSLVYGISTTDPVTFIGVPMILGAVALLANYIPALQATRIDPMKALRME